MGAVDVAVAGTGVSPASIETVREILKTKVVDVLRSHVPQLSALPRAVVYDRIMDTPPLLAACFRLMRTSPALFETVLAGPDRRLVTRDEDRLSCGRTLGEVVALVVRASARRYFRAVLPAAQAPATIHQDERQRHHWLHRAAVQLGIKAPPKVRAAHHRATQPHGRAEKLYQAMRDLLRFDWQVPLIPQYAGIEPAVVAKLGERLLRFRSPEPLQVLAEEGLPGGLLPILLDDARRLIAPDGGFDPEALWLAVDKLGLPAAHPEMDRTAWRRTLAHVSTTPPMAAQMLVPALGEDIRRVTVLLTAAYRKLGMQDYRRVFASDDAVRRLAHRAQAAAWPDDVKGMEAMAEALVDSERTAGSRCAATPTTLPPLPQQGKWKPARRG
ncbi:MAG: hypothetical protein ACM31L_08030 [Actinomycetota bacterium]